MNARIEALEPILLQCYKCLEKGQVRAQCGNGDRAACCYRCGKEGHIARDCKSPVRCPICASLKRPDGHKADSRACMAPKRRAKERTTQPTPFPRTNVVSREREGGDIGEEIHTQEVEMRGVEDLPPLPQREKRERPSDRLPPTTGEENSPMEAEPEEPNSYK